MNQFIRLCAIISWITVLSIHIKIADGQQCSAACHEAVETAKDDAGMLLLNLLLCICIMFANRILATNICTNQDEGRYTYFCPCNINYKLNN